MAKRWILLSLLIMIAGAATLVFIPVSRMPIIGWDAQYDQQGLIGLSYAQVIQKLGAADYDQRASGRWKTEQQDGPLAISYYGPVGQTYVVKFSGDRVTTVERFYK